MKLEKIIKVLDEDTLTELNNMGKEEISKMIIQAEQVIRDTKEELEANPKYQELKELLKALRSGYTEVKNRQTAKIQYGLIRLGEMGEPVETA